MDSYRMSGPPKGQPDECPNCFDPIEYWQDPEGIWAECTCTGGYLQ